MRRAIFNHLHGAGFNWEDRVIDVDLSNRRTDSPYGPFYTAYLTSGEKGLVFESELTWLDEVEPTDGELLDAFDAEEDEPLVIGGKLTEAGAIYVLDLRASGEE